MKIIYSVLIVILILLAAAGYNYSYSAAGSRKLRDGYYTAEAAEYIHGWKEFITIYVNNGRIVTAEYNAKNRSGLIKSWDMDYMRVMNETDGNYPNRYARGYASALIANQSTERIDAMSGATESYRSFMLLADAVITQAKAGDKSVAFVNVPEPGQAGR
ncbi:MAG: FMN-binding protein [Synergistaceae bacterium]|jgi:major membrane immunogen (membrane-anchored lipoprotein)|nr:FMN-binding protein [Synergistaceae bacterium]